MTLGVVKPPSRRQILGLAMAVMCCSGVFADPYLLDKLGGRWQVVQKAFERVERPEQ